MKLTGALQLAMPIERVWAIFMDPHQLCAVLPGCEDARQIDPTHYEATLATKVQFMTIRAHASIEMLEAQEPHHVVAEMVGKTLAMAGAFRAHMTVDLLENLDTSTDVRYSFDLTMLGRLGSLGEPIVRGTAGKLADQFASNLQSTANPT